VKNHYSLNWYEFFLENIDPGLTEKEASFIRRQLPNPPYRLILDACCGRGRHASLLAENGYLINGIDLNSSALKLAKKRVPQATFIRMDIRHLDALRTDFDGIVNLWQSFGYDEPAANLGLLRLFSSKLRLGGRLVLDVYQRGFFENHQSERRFEHDGIQVVEHKTLRSGRLTVRLEYPPPIPDDTYEWQLYIPQELIRLARGVGLKCTLVCAGFEEDQPASPEIPRMQLVFEKRNQTKKKNV
jgi:SAM-dependent methyltransferase